MDLCKLREPKVIDNALLERCVVEQLPKGEAGRLAALEGLPLSEVPQVRLEFHNILKIDHLWVMTSLTRLSLNNNLIERIENLDTLTKLVELDLSFNHITKIENIDMLVNLEKLTFYENGIAKLENMDTLKKLAILSVGKNKLDSIDDLIYLRRLSSLKSLNLSGNPLEERTDNFRALVAAYVPQIVYYEYRLVYPKERQRAAEMYKNDLRNVERDEEVVNTAKRIEEEKLRAAEVNAKSFVEYLDSTQLFEQLFENDRDGKALQQIGDEVEEFFDEYSEQFNALCRSLFEVGQEQYKIRRAELDEFDKCVNEAQRENQAASIKHMEAFLGHKAEIFAAIRHLQEQLNWQGMKYEQYAERCNNMIVQFENHLHQTWKALMKLEMELHEQLEEVNTNLEHALTEMVNVFVEAAQAHFTQIRSLEVTYAENVGEAVNKYHTMLNLNEEIVVPEAVKHIVREQKVITNTLADSHDMHMQIIDNREDVMINKAKDWHYELVTGLEKGEIKRNRIKVLEINHFSDIQREEFDDLNAEYGADVGAEVTDLLEG